MVQVQPGISSQGKQTLQAGPVNAQTRVVTNNAYALLMKIKNTEAEE
jgi:cobalt-zinc-cadmium efflux system membrane fusion protein